MEDYNPTPPHPFRASRKRRASHHVCVCVQVQRIVSTPTQSKLQKYVETHSRRRSKKENSHENTRPIRGPTTAK